jgi:DNA-binding PadR family transcriptional regulator
MTPKQWRMLEILEHWDKAWRVNRLVVAGLVRSLVAKGYATDDQDGYGITDAGRALLEKRKSRARTSGTKGDDR